MALVEKSGFSHAAPLSLEGLARWFAEKRAAFAHWREVRATENALRGLSARELQDLGLDRSQIMSAARHPHERG